MKVQAQAWIGEAEGEKATVDVELTDPDEIRLGVQLADDAVALYFSRATADKLARFLAAASVDEFGDE